MVNTEERYKKVIVSIDEQTEELWKNVVKKTDILKGLEGSFIDEHQMRNSISKDMEVIHKLHMLRLLLRGLLDIDHEFEDWNLVVKDYATVYMKG